MSDGRSGSESLKHVEDLYIYIYIYIYIYTPWLMRQTRNLWSLKHQSKENITRKKPSASTCTIHKGTFRKFGITRLRMHQWHMHTRYSLCVFEAETFKGKQNFPFFISPQKLIGLLRTGCKSTTSLSRRLQRRP